MYRFEGLIVAIGLVLLTKDGAAFTLGEGRSQPFACPMAESWSRRRLVAFMSVDDDNVVDVGSDPKLNASQDEQRTPKVAVKCPNCDKCDGSGRILGGLGAVLPWMPVKAYRPCPNFIQRGGEYKRSGQGLDEIAFGAEGKSD